MAFSKKRSGSETRKRGPIIGFRATEAEKATIQAAAERVGLTSSSYVRSRALAKPETRAVRRPPVQTAQLAQILGLLGIAGGSLQGIAQALARSGSVPAPELQACLAEFRTAASAIMQSLGKRPHDY